jgi:uncharacterized protein YbbC (DUF1343 family)
MGTETGLDVLASESFARLRGKKVGLLCNQASIASDHRHAIDLFRAHCELGAIFGPQHGLFGHTQDNMIEWEGEDRPSSGPPIYSLYGEHREPTPAMLEGLDLLVIDLQEVGARYYTFIWTMALCMKQCAARGIPVLVLDRPNPIGGLQVEGTVQEPGFESFVGLHPLPMRHGLSIGELARWLKDSTYPATKLEVVEMRSWSRSDYFDQTGLPWAMPSPNMPSLDTAVVYPGACLLEGTNLSEGRGTTRPFETFGAPYLDAWTFTNALNQLGLPGCRFRAIQFQPTFQKHAGELCQGAFLHVIDRKAFEPVLTYVAILQVAIGQAENQFRWNDPPYEYEVEKLPIDILGGNHWLREAIVDQVPLNHIRQRFLEECHAFEPQRSAAMLYPTH